MNPAQAFKRLDWVLILSVLTLVFLGLTTMKSFSPPIGGEQGGDYFFNRQIVWIFVGLAVFFVSAIFIDWSFLKTNSIFLMILYLILILTLVFLILAGRAIKGAASWLKVGGTSVEPVELIKLIIVLILAKYFSKRHIEIARILHLAISFLYAALPMVLVALQPDLGSALVLGAIWLGMALVGGIKLKHLLALFVLGAVAALIFWSYFLLPYQKARVISFLNPQSDVSGRGYHAIQSVIAIGSGQIFGKGIGFGTQSRLEFLPEHETDFIFAAFAEEWGFLGILILLLFFSLVVWRILRAGIYGESNFEKLYATGLAIFLSFQAGIHIGMNSGVLPITGLGMPFLSYGGSSLITLFLALGILESFSLHKKGILLGGEERYKEGILGA
ncbi:rod shape-determining protein RodA [Candidatus Giovannonibacteria bacterium RIFCSPLOWO2_12_FULL_44_25]|uniref:Probable peptidoglycan glycosyltransferase FtsW n=4 Tax=Parcubacteria group TaxID=1794811 RepID=A0A837IJ21_9BACT|nr:MAG: Rod shape-determining protein [Parcubacteria group bacterium GW2011_GWC1_44_10]KKT57343.1 MAG: Rod shape-determining protein [Candidatus Giovannonibacteria bacterium GW2011_GWB1_44_23]KKT59691.1 MAG: Rod shape-determining protein [Candidatus Giovannonibacteria bacterium GW2011_GWA1_44_25]KKU12779.1 MAG: Rod shape-determining protein [Candidatus Azambacteria bacterium GW2011_GWC2_45_7b]OGF50068.1 MAG: rod shape-determining protein RodA [Candidatus Giovannonibacteria bacterium GWA2_45_15]